MYETPESLEPVFERETDTLAPGIVVGGAYRVLERLGTGGMADVYEAEHLRLNNRVALKVLRTSGRGERPGIERFRHEAQRVTALTSEHVVKVFDSGELANGTPYLVMERLWGEDLRSLLAREGPLPIRRAVELAIGACRGLSAVHAAGLVHRDLKPANLFVVRRSDGADWCKILDFGVAKALISDATASGALLGTVRYMAPEQLEDASSARATADVYALGVVLYESLTGAPPHDGTSLQELMFRILHHDTVPPSKLRAIPVELDAIVLKALSRDSAKRFSSADEMARALAVFGAVAPRQQVSEAPGERTLDDQSLHRPARSNRFKSAYPLWMALGSVVTLASVGLGRGWVSKDENLAKSNVTASIRRLLPTSRIPLPLPKLVVVQETKQALIETPPQSQILTASGVRRVSQRAAKAKGSPAAQADRFDTKDPYVE